MSGVFQNCCCGSKLIPAIESVEGVCAFFGWMPYKYDPAELVTTHYLQQESKVTWTDLYPELSTTVIERVNHLDGLPLKTIRSGGVPFIDGFDIGQTPYTMTETEKKRTILFDDGGIHPGGIAGIMEFTLSDPFYLDDAMGLAIGASNFIGGSGSGPYPTYFWDGTPGEAYYYGFDTPPQYRTRRRDHFYCQWSSLVPTNRSIWPGDASPWCVSRQIHFHGDEGLIGGVMSQDVICFAKRGRVRSPNGLCESLRLYNLAAQTWGPFQWSSRSARPGIFDFPLPAPEEEHGALLEPRCP